MERGRIPDSSVEQADDLSDSQMQTLAREFNLPETIFIQRPEQPTHTAKVRIFLPLEVGMQNKSVTAVRVSGSSVSISSGTIRIPD